MTSSGRVSMTSSGSGQNSGRVNDRVRIRVGSGQTSGRQMTSAKRLPDRDAPVGTVARVSVKRRRLSCACRRVAAGGGASGLLRRRATHQFSRFDE